MKPGLKGLIKNRNLVFWLIVATNLVLQLFYQLKFKSLTFDESETYLFASLKIGDLLALNPYQNYPPFYHLVVGIIKRVLRLHNPTIFSIFFRTLSAVFAILGLHIVFKTKLDNQKRQTNPYIYLFLAGMPLFVTVFSQSRMYSLLFFASAAVMYLLTNKITPQLNRYDIWLFIALFVLFSSHTAAIFMAVPVAISLILLSPGIKTALVRLLYSIASTAWFAIWFLSAHLKNRPLDRWDKSWYFLYQNRFLYQLNTIAKLLFHSTDLSAYLLVTLGLLIFGFKVIRETHSGKYQKTILLLNTLVPVTIGFFFGFSAIKFYTPVLPFLLLMVIACLGDLEKRSRLACLFLVTVFAFINISISARYLVEFPGTCWKSVFTDELVQGKPLAIVYPYHNIGFNLIYDPNSEIQGFLPDLPLQDTTENNFQEKLINLSRTNWSTRINKRNVAEIDNLLGDQTEFTLILSDHLFGPETYLILNHLRNKGWVAVRRMPFLCNRNPSIYTFIKTPTTVSQIN